MAARLRIEQGATIIPATGTDPDEMLAAVYAADGPEANRSLYARWAATYETGFVTDRRYGYPEQVVSVFAEHGLAGVGEGDAVVDVGCGTGLAGVALRRRAAVAVDGLDISPEMLALVPDGTIPVLGDGSRLALPDGSVDALLLINMFLFPAEADRVVSPDGVVVWVSSRGPETPIYLAADEVDRALPGDWDGVAATAGYGTWSVHWRRST